MRFLRSDPLDSTLVDSVRSDAVLAGFQGGTDLSKIRERARQLADAQERSSLRALRHSDAIAWTRARIAAARDRRDWHVVAGGECRSARARRWHGFWAKWHAQAIRRLFMRDARLVAQEQRCAAAHASRMAALDATLDADHAVGAALRARTCQLDATATAAGVRDSSIT